MLSVAGAAEIIRDAIIEQRYGKKFNSAAAGEVDTEAIRRILRQHYNDKLRYDLIDYRRERSGVYGATTSEQKELASALADRLEGLGDLLDNRNLPEPLRYIPIPPELIERLTYEQGEWLLERGWLDKWILLARREARKKRSRKGIVKQTRRTRDVEIRHRSSLTLVLDTLEKRRAARTAAKLFDHHELKPTVWGDRKQGFPPYIRLSAAIYFKRAGPSPYDCLQMNKACEAIRKERAGASI
jgi:hypothetical protein